MKSLQVMAILVTAGLLVIAMAPSISAQTNEREVPYAGEVNGDDRAPCLADSRFSITFTEDDACDRNDSTGDAFRWASADSPYPHWLVISFDGTFTLTRVHIIWSAPDRPFGMIQYYNDNHQSEESEWVDIVVFFEVANLAPPAVQHANYSLREVTTGAIRIYGLGLYGIVNQLMSIFEVTVFGYDTSVSPFPNFLEGAVTWGMLFLLGIVAIMAIIYWARKRQ